MVALVNHRLSGLVILALILLTLPLLIQNSYFFNVAINVGLRAMACIGLALLLGYAGQISLGHAGFFAIGAYASAILPGRFGMPPMLALVLGLVLAAALAFIVGRPILRLKGHLLAMATIAFGTIVYIILNQNVELFGGPDGIPVGHLGVGNWTLSGDKQWYVVTAIVLLLGTWGALNIVQSPIGRALYAIKGSEVAALVSGVDVARYKVMIFVISAVYASLAGSLFAHYNAFITPAEAELHFSLEYLIIVIVGGMGSIFGVLLGAALLTALPQILTSLHDYETLVFGVVLTGTIIFLPKGILPTLVQHFRRESRDA